MSLLNVPQNDSLVRSSRFSYYAEDATHFSASFIPFRIQIRPSSKHRTINIATTVQPFLRLQFKNQMQLLSVPNLIKKLQTTIMKLQSDQVLLQMRNDSSLYSCKMTYIKEMIEDEMNACMELAESAAFVEGLQERLREREVSMERMKGEYAVELENIERHCKEFIAQFQKKLKDKEEEVVRLRNEVEGQRSKTQKVENGLSAAKQEILKLKQENGSLKQDRSQLEELRSQLEGEIAKLKKQVQNKERHSQTSMRQSYDQQYNKMVNEYEQKLLQMQRDMGTIKECWEKACLQLKAKMQEELTLEIIECENKFKRDLQQYAENLKMGSSVVFSDSEEIINKKVEIIKRGYTEEMNKLAEEVKRFQEELAQLRGELEEKEERIGELADSLKQRQRQIESNNKQYRSAVTDKEREMETMRTELQNLSKEIMASKKKNHQLEEEARQSKDQLKSLTKKYNIASSKASELQEEVDACNKKISSQNAKIDEHLNKLISLREETTAKEQSITTLTAQTDKLKKTAQQLQNNLNHQMQESLQLNLKLRRDKQEKQRIIEKMSRLQIHIRKVSKDSQMLREEVNCTVQMLKNKTQSLFSLFNDTLIQKIEAMTRKHKQQMSELLDQMQEKEKEMVANLASEKQELKLDIKEYQQVIKEKQGDINRLKSYISQLQQTKKDLIMDLESQKLFTIRLQEKIESNEHSYASNIGKVQKEVSRSMSNFNTYWSEQIGKVQHQLDGKDAKLKQYAEKIEHLSNQLQENKKEQSWIQDQAKKYKKKYENLKQERDEKIESLLKKLEQQGKHRINLERELKQVRMSVMKGTYQSSNSNNFSFNDKERQSSNKPFTTNTKQDQHLERERQFSEIREMIAKTYKVVDGPAERDIGRNFSKKALF